MTKGPAVTLSKAQVKSIKDLLSRHGNDLPAFLEQLDEASSRAAPKSHAATEYKDLMEVADALGVDYLRDSPMHFLTLKDSQLQDDRSLSQAFGNVIHQLQTSPYTKYRRFETISRTMLDLILLDRLNSLQDQHVAYHLRLSPEVPISANTYDIHGNEEVIRGRVDWALNYDTPQSQTGSILIVIEAKAIDNAGVGMPQLLAYMVGVLETRRGRKNQSVFGMLSDTGIYRFTFLDQNKKLYVSRPFEWARDRSMILAHIDTILLDAIESSPHTTPTKFGNRSLNNYRWYLEERWVFGDGSEDKAKRDIRKESIVDVIQGRNMVVRTKRQEDKDGEDED